MSTNPGRETVSDSELLWTEPARYFDPPTNDWLDQQAKLTPCFAFSQGYCPDGITCPFVHEDAGTEPSPLGIYNELDPLDSVQRVDSLAEFELGQDSERVATGSNHRHVLVTQDSWGITMDDLNTEQGNENGLSRPPNHDSQQDGDYMACDHSFVSTPNSTEDHIVAPALKAQKKERSQFATSTRIILETAFEIEPYPDAAELSSIAQRACLSETQVKTWFGNKRSRAHPTENQQRKDAVQILEDVTSNAKLHQIEDALFDWFNSERILPVDDNVLKEKLCHFAMAVGLDAHQLLSSSWFEGLKEQYCFLARTPRVSHGFEDKDPVNNTQKTLRPEESPAMSSIKDSPGLPSLRRAPLTRRSLEILRRLTAEKAKDFRPVSSDEGSDQSVDSMGSALSSTSRTSRRGRRQWASGKIKKPNGLKSRPPGRIASLTKVAFSCTFCNEQLRNKYAWKRHEETVHLQLHKWVCKIAEACENRLTGNSQLDAELFCPSRPVGWHSTSNDWAVKYNVARCSASRCSQDDRSYHRRDHLNQHLRTVHGIDLRGEKASLVDVWKVEVNLPPGHAALKCPFCIETFETWAARLDHVAEHFKTMKIPLKPLLAAANSLSPQNTSPTAQKRSLMTPSDTGNFRNSPLPPAISEAPQEQYGISMTPCVTTTEAENEFDWVDIGDYDDDWACETV